MALDDFQKLNNLMANNFDPKEVLLLEPPKKNIWDTLKEDEMSTNRQIEEKKVEKMYEVNGQKNTAQSSQTTTTSKPGYGYSGGTTTTTTRNYSSEDLVEREFRELRDAAFKIADEELKNKSDNRKPKNNPQLEVLMKGNNGFISKIKDTFKEGSWGRKGLLIAGMITVKGFTTMLFDMKNKKN